eukprot:PhF_6_TR34936/c0_g1_i3/m.50647/K15013/ACSBG; long-chain-fatty-acid--CoA ligase ACSBG
MMFETNPEKEFLRYTPSTQSSEGSMGLTSSFSLRPEEREPITVYQSLLAAVKSKGEKAIAMRMKKMKKSVVGATTTVGGKPASSPHTTTQETVEWTYGMFRNDVLRVARSLLACNIKRHNTVLIIGANSPEWVIAALGAQSIGVIPAGVFVTTAPEALFSICKKTNPRAVFADEESHANRIRKVLSRTMTPEQFADVLFVVWGEGGFSSQGGVSTPITASGIPHASPPPRRNLSVSFSSFASSAALTAETQSSGGDCTWQQFLDEYSHGTCDAELELALQEVRPGHAGAIMFTSGTTGDPKAVLLNHDSLTWTAAVLAQSTQLSKSERVVSFLPLAHIAALMTDVYLMIAVGACVTFAPADALRGSLGETLREARPTLFLAVPRVWERFQESILEFGKKQNVGDSGLRRVFVNWAKRVGRETSQADSQQSSRPLLWRVADVMVHQKVKKALGFDDCRLFLSAAAPLRSETIEYFASMHIPITQAYGMTECAGPTTFCVSEKFRLHTVGYGLPGIKFKEVPGTNEVCWKGRNVMMGYLNDPEATAAVIDENGYLHSGDIGTFDKAGYLTITGRLKDIIITANGDNIVPGPIEEAIKSECPFINDVVVVGDLMQYAVCLIGLKVTQGTRQLLEPIGDSRATTIEEAKTCPRVQALLEAAIEKVNRKAPNKGAQIQRYTILPRELSVEAGEMTQTMKVKRHYVIQKYKELWMTMYA